MENFFGQAANAWLETAVRVLSCGNHGVIKHCHSSSPDGHQVNQTALGLVTRNFAFISGPNKISLGTIYRATRVFVHYASIALNIVKQVVMLFHRFTWD